MNLPVNFHDGDYEVRATLQEASVKFPVKFIDSQTITPLKIRVEFQDGEKEIPISFSEEEFVDISFENAYEISPSKPIESYTGPYQITPHSYEQTLETTQKKMNQNLTIREIPYAPVTNSSGGITVTIGGEG